MDQRIAYAIRCLPYRQVAVAHRLGLSPSALSDRMRGRTPFTLREAKIIAEITGRSLDDLVGDDNPPIGYTLTEQQPAAV